MSRIRSTNTHLEKTVFRFLWRNKIHFQRHYRKAHGNPDIALPRKRKQFSLTAISGMDGNSKSGRAESRKITGEIKLPTILSATGETERDEKRRVACIAGLGA